MKKIKAILASALALSMTIMSLIAFNASADATFSEVTLGAPTFAKQNTTYSAYDEATGKVTLVGDAEAYAVYNVQTDGAFVFEADAKMTSGALFGFTFGNPAKDKSDDTAWVGCRVIVETGRMYAATPNGEQLLTNTYTVGDTMKLKLEVDDSANYKVYVDSTQKLSGTVPEGFTPDGYIGLIAGWAAVEFTNVKLTMPSTDTSSDDTSSDDTSSDDTSSDDTSSDDTSSDDTSSDDTSSDDTSSDDTSSDEDPDTLPPAEYDEPIGPAFGIDNFWKNDFGNGPAFPVPEETKDGILIQSDSNFTGEYPGITLTSEAVDVDGLEVVYRYDGFNGDGDDGSTTDAPQIRFALMERPEKLTFWCNFEGTGGSGFMATHHIFDEDTQFFEGVQMDPTAGANGEYRGQGQYRFFNDAPAGSVFVIKFEYVGEDDMKITVNGKEIPGDFKAYRTIAEANNGKMYFATCADMYTTALPKPMIKYTLISIDGRAVSPLQLSNDESSTTDSSTISSSTTGTPATGVSYPMIPMVILLVAGLSLIVIKKSHATI